MRSRVASAILALMATSCLGSAATTTTTSSPTTTRPPDTTATTAADVCPDVFCVVYRIDPDARWSDGEPVVADDFAHTLALLDETSANPGYALITGHEIRDDKTFVVAMSEVFAPWRTLFEIVLPAHATHDEANPGPGTGPFTLVEWVPGDRIVLTRNPWYRPPPDMTPGDVDELRLVFPVDVRTMIGDLGEGAVDVIDPRPLGWMVSDVGELEGVASVVGPGPFWEHLSFNHDDPLLSQPWVREALRLALDREAILDATVRTIDPDARGLGSTVFMEGSPWYREHHVSTTDPERAEQILLDHFCERGEDDVFSCQGRHLSFIWATTVGDDLRQTQVEMAASQLEAIGVEIVPRYLTPSELFTSDVIFGGPSVWQIMSFSWKAAADPFLGDSTYLCTGDSPIGMGALNVNRYCDEDVERLILATRTETDPQTRADLYNEADRLYLEDIAVIPLYQKPMLLAWVSDLTGPALNPGGTDLWNVGSWTGKSTVIVALEDEPESLAPLLAVDDASALVRSVLYQGAFMVTPTLEYVPALVETAEVMVP
ncbi:MAG: ABC transporter substrate-binding protein [Actinobacteria bacterium]|nr:ABC transporter substrate-binding protein [Actinomycetota bacterium]